MGQMDFCSQANSISDCVNNGDVYASSGAVGGILGSYGILSLNITEETCACFTIDGCVNYGNVANGDGILGTGGILGLSATMTDSTDELLITECINYGEISAKTAGHVGGILGSSEKALSGGVTKIASCANSGNILFGDGQGVYKTPDEILAVAEEDEEDSAETVASNKTILMVGSSALGGIVGHSRLCIVSDCANIGKIYYSSESSAFSGGICGMYLYIPDTDTYTIETSSLTACVSTNEVEAAYGLAYDWGEETISDVTLVSPEQAQSAFEAIESLIVVAEYGSVSGNDQE